MLSAGVPPHLRRKAIRCRQPDRRARPVPERRILGRAASSRRGAEGLTANEEAALRIAREEGRVTTGSLAASTGMTRHDGKGVCRICGEARELSFEHIPPKSLGDNGPSKMYRAADIVEERGAFDSSRTEGVGYQQQQRGTGFRTLCRDCNSYLGRNYVGEYTECMKELGHMLARNPPAEGEGGLRLEGKGINLLGFFKHVIGNFCATTEAGSMSDCRTFLLDREDRDFPDRYRPFMFAVPRQGAGMLATGWATLLLNPGRADRYTVAAVAAFPVSGK